MVLPHFQMTVHDLFEAYPQAVAVFIRYRMGCVGCNMACFETLRDAAEIYGIEPEIFLEEIRASIRSGGPPA